MSGQRASMLTAAAVASLSAQDLGLPSLLRLACQWLRRSEAGVAACVVSVGTTVELYSYSTLKYQLHLSLQLLVLVLTTITR